MNSSPFGRWLLARNWLPRAAAVALCACTAQPTDAPAPAPAPAPSAALLDQGPRWTATDRAAFYTQDQGARIIDLTWINALRLPDGTPFLADGLARYGYLPNPPNPLPVGFTNAGGALGMTCAACHTRQITVANTAYRIDGGPAIVDFQSFLADLDRAAGDVLASPAAFTPFAARVLGHPPTDAERATLQAQLRAWYGRYHTLMDRALPTTPWGPARLDAVGMIFNRVTGLDIGATPDRMIADNIHRADAPVRYPFLWNAAIQDRTQWPGFAENGNWLLALGRNTGEVYGVFAAFAPHRNPIYPIGYDYIAGNSANFSGLERLNTLMTDIGPPKWPFAVNAVLAARGAQIFGQSPSQGQCAGCHWPRTGAPALFARPTWKTPILDVGTDRREYDVLNWRVDTGVLNGAAIPVLIPALAPIDTATRVLKVAVVGSILQHITLPVPLLNINIFGPEPAAHAAGAYPKQATQLAALYDGGPKPVAAYEARVLQGIWAAAPYLHNGAVPTLADLLTPPDQRPAAFAVGPAYDTNNVGLAETQTAFGAAMIHTTGCDAPDSGSSRCGHNYGTTLSPDDKRALLEYLKVL